MNLFNRYPLLWSLVVAVVAGIAYFQTRLEPILILGLFMLFTLKEGKQDERTKMIAYSSAYFAFFLGVAFTFLIPSLNQHGIISSKEVSANFFIIRVLALANVIRFTRQYLMA
jgi:hypothetical protein